MKLFTLIILLMATALARGETCYQISSSEGIWSKTPELICIDPKDANNSAEITLKSGMIFNEKLIATFHLDLLERARCMDCNQDIYGVSSPSDSTFNRLNIHFDGVRNMQTMSEEGLVHIGDTKFHYRSL